MPRKTHEQLSSLIDQSFDVFDVYGKKPEQVENIVLAFNVSLAEFTAQEITWGFRQWMNSQEVFPKPASIRKLILQRRAGITKTEEIKQQEMMTYADYKIKKRGTWEDYKGYVRDYQEATNA